MGRNRLQAHCAETTTHNAVVGGPCLTLNHPSLPCMTTPLGDIRRARSLSPAPPPPAASRGAAPPLPPGHRQPPSHVRKRAASEPLAAPPKHARHVLREGDTAGSGGPVRGRDAGGTNPPSGHNRGPGLGTVGSGSAGMSSGTRERPVGTAEGMRGRDTGTISVRGRVVDTPEHSTSGTSSKAPPSTGSIKMQCVREIKKPVSHASVLCVACLCIRSVDIAPPGCHIVNVTHWDYRALNIVRQR